MASSCCVMSFGLLVHTQAFYDFALMLIVSQWVLVLSVFQSDLIVNGTFLQGGDFDQKSIIQKGTKVQLLEKQAWSSTICLNISVTGAKACYKNFTPVC